MKKGRLYKAKKRERQFHELSRRASLIATLSIIAMMLVGIGAFIARKRAGLLPIDMERRPVPPLPAIGAARFSTPPGTGQLAAPSAYIKGPAPKTDDTSTAVSRATGDGK